MRLKRWGSTAAALLLAAMLLAGCGQQPAGGQGQASEPAPAASESGGPAAELAKAMSDNKSTMFPFIGDLTELPAPVSIIVKDEGTFFLEGGSLPLADPEAANGLLLVSLSKNSDDTYSCTLTLGSPTGDISVGIANSLKLETPAGLEALLKENYTFAEGEAALLDSIRAYEDKLAGKDYLTAINACRDDYDTVSGLKGVSRQQVCEPLVYMMDEDYVCEALQEGTIAFIPAERRQYVPPEGEADAYVRPEIAGPVSLGITNIGRVPDEDGRAVYTMADVAKRLEEPGDTFCFAEIVGTKYYGQFSSKENDDVVQAYSYNMRVSVISMDGELLGHTTVSYQPPAEDSFGLNAQMIAISLSRDKNGMVVFQSGYRSAFWEQF